MHSFIRRVEKKNNEMFKEMKHSKGSSSNIDDYYLEDKIDEKIDIFQQKNKNYIDKVINEMKMMMRQSSKESIQMDIKYSSPDL